MAKIRVLVVDDAVVIRKFLSEALSSLADIEVCATAPNGKLALTKLPMVNPDAVILDVEMPEMDGIATLVELRKTYKELPVIMFSAHTQAGAAVTLDALQRGANDFVTKPSGSGNIQQNMEHVRDQLATRIRIFCKRSHEGISGSRTAIRPSASPELIRPGLTIPQTMTTTINRPAGPRPSRGRVEILAIGVSTGGPNALAEVIPLLPKDLPVPAVIVQHMPPMFTRMLAERLASKAQIPVVEGANGTVLVPGHAYLAPGDWHMLVERVDGQLRLRLNQGPQENSCRPAVDPLFRSVAEVCGPNVLSVVMTGMGQDGTRGAQSIREAGGQVMVQDEATSVVWGMPGSIVKAGLADQVVPLNQIASEIMRRLGRGG